MASGFRVTQKYKCKINVFKNAQELCNNDVNKTIDILIKVTGEDRC